MYRLPPRVDLKKRAQVENENEIQDEAPASNETDNIYATPADDTYMSHSGLVLAAILSAGPGTIEPEKPAFWPYFAQPVTSVGYGASTEDAGHEMRLENVAPTQPAEDRYRFSLAGQLRSAVTPSLDDVPWVENVAVPRIRTKFKARLLGESRLAVQVNTSPDKIEWVDIYIDVPISDRIALRAGQHKIAFGTYRQQSNFDLVFTDWSPTTRFFGAERQLGFTGTVLALSAFEFSLGAYAGDNARASHGRGAAALRNITLNNRSSLIDGASYTGLHPEVVGRSVYRHRAGTISGSFAWDSDPTQTDFRGRATLDAVFNLGQWTLWSVLYGAALSSELDSFGALTETSFAFTEQWAAAVRYSWLDTSEAREQSLFPPWIQEWTLSVRFDPTSEVTLQADCNAVLTPGATDFGARVQLGFQL